MTVSVSSAHSVSHIQFSQGSSSVEDALKVLDSVQSLKSAPIYEFVFDPDAEIDFSRLDSSGRLVVPFKRFRETELSEEQLRFFASFHIRYTHESFYANFSDEEVNEIKPAHVSHAIFDYLNGIVYAETFLAEHDDVYIQKKYELYQLMGEEKSYKFMKGLSFLGERHALALTFDSKEWSDCLRVLNAANEVIADIYPHVMEFMTDVKNLRNEFSAEDNEIIHQLLEMTFKKNIQK